MPHNRYQSHTKPSNTNPTDHASPHSSPICSNRDHITTNHNHTNTGANTRRNATSIRNNNIVITIYTKPIVIVQTDNFYSNINQVDIDQTIVTPTNTYLININQINRRPVTTAASNNNITIDTKPIVIGQSDNSHINQDDINQTVIIPFNTYLISINQIDRRPVNTAISDTKPIAN